MKQKDHTNQEIPSSSPKIENVYERAMIIARRARQILEHRKESFYGELERMGLLGVEKGQLIKTDGWQKELAKSYEKKKKPIAWAEEELEADKLLYFYLPSQT